MAFARPSFLLLIMSASLAACAADPGDAPKGDDGGGSPRGDDAAPPTGGEDSASPSIDGGGVDATIPTLDSSSAPPTRPIDSGGPDHAGSVDAGFMDAPDGTPDATVATCTSCPLVVRYMTANTSAMSNTMSPEFEILNNGASPEDLTVVTLRYYYTAQGSTSQTFACDYFPAGCGSVAASFVAMPAPTATADHYMQIAFTSGSIPSGASTGGLQTRLYDSTFAVTFNQAMDYSFNPSDTAFTPWDHVTLYVSGSLAYGVEP
jgi:hypothetical protein